MGVDARENAVARDERRVGRREANDKGVRRRASSSSSSSRGVVVVVARVVVARAATDRTTLARGADERDEGGDFLPRVE